MTAPEATINKTVNQTSISGTTTLTYTILVDNSGTVDLNNPVLTDQLVQNGSTLTLTSGPTLSSGDSDGDGFLDTNETWIYTATYDVASGDISDGNDLVNTATFNSDETSAISDSATTTITGPPTNATLTLLKSVTNVTAVDTDWTLSFSGPSTGSGIKGDVAITNAPIFAGAYTLSESGAPADYALRYLTCTGAADLSTSPTNPNITIAPGENVNCVFENRRGRTITLLKEVVGGVAADTDWTLSAVSTAINRSGVEGDGTITGVGANSAPITLSESGGPAASPMTSLM